MPDEMGRLWLENSTVTGFCRDEILDFAFEIVLTDGRRISPHLITEVVMCLLLASVLFNLSSTHLLDLFLLK